MNKLLTEEEEIRFKHVVQTATCFQDIHREFQYLHYNQINSLISRLGLRRPYMQGMTKKTKTERAQKQTRQKKEIEQHHRNMILKYFGEAALQEHIEAQRIKG